MKVDKRKLGKQIKMVRTSKRMTPQALPESCGDDRCVTYLYQLGGNRY
mgnify:CR=1 FL=1